MAAAAQMSDLKPLPESQRSGAGEHAGQHRDMIEKVGVPEHVHDRDKVVCSAREGRSVWE